ncbi:uncharacterized protein LOC115227906 [Octopus sinensis]|uniref:Uncharacterized protein LOC115227906 n=1 Tax=Octopus sinensis TaxID=2607531 RepID=A0A6P7TRS3_9MOLL|nr:uncharacterized protein LOC115227906 [Octopus sinensis]
MSTQPNIPSVKTEVTSFVHLHDFTGTDNNWAKNELYVDRKNISGLFASDAYRVNPTKKVTDTLKSRIGSQLMKSLDGTELSRIGLYQSLSKWKFKENTIKSEEKMVVQEDNITNEEFNPSNEVRTQSYYSFSGKRDKKLVENPIEAKNFLSKKAFL